MFGQGQDLVGDGLDLLTDVGHADGGVLNRGHAGRRNAIRLARRGGDGFRKLGSRLGRSLDLFDGGAGFGNGRRLRCRTRRLLGDGGQNGFTCTRQTLGATLDFARQLAQLDEHGADGFRHLAELVLRVDRDGLIEVAGGQRAGSVGDLPHRQGDGARQQG